MLKRFYAVFLLVAAALTIGVFSVGAQSADDSAIRDRAVAVAAQHNPAVASALVSTWEWQSLFQTNDGALGCTGVASYDLGYAVTPYRVMLDFRGIGRYVVFVSSDPNVSVLCQTPDGVSRYVTPVSRPDNWTPESARCTASAFRAGGAAIFDAPESGTYLGDLGDVSFFPVVSRTADSSWYELTIGSRSGWVSFYDVRLAGAGCVDLPVTSSFATTQPIAVHANMPISGINTQLAQCTLVAIYANVRTLPGMSQPIIDQIVRDQVYYVVGITADGDWRQIWMGGNVYGFVHESVSNISGTGCADVPVVGEAISAPIATQCPLDFAGYLPPALLVNASAQVSVTGGLNLRQNPTPDAVVLAELPANQVINISAGPLCEDGRMWWQTVFNGLSGWVAESDANIDQRYLIFRAAPPGQRSLADRQINSAEVARMEVSGAVADIAFSPDGESFAVVNGLDNVVKFWNTDSVSALPQSLTHDLDSRVNFVEFSAVNDEIITGDDFNVFNIWQDGEIRLTIQPDFAPYFNSAVAISEDWSKLAIGGCLDGEFGAGCTNGGAIVYDMRTGEELMVVSDFSGAVRELAFNTNASRMALTVNDGNVFIFDANVGSLVFLLELRAERIGMMRFSPDGATLAVANCPALMPTDAGGLCESSRVSVFDAETGDLSNTIAGPSDEISSLAFSPDGLLLAIGSYDNTVLLWDLVENEPVETFSGFANGVVALSFTPESDKLGVGDNSGVVILFNTSGGQ